MSRRKKILEPNYEVRFQSAVEALQATYEEYKIAVIKNIQCSFYNKDGIYSILGDLSVRAKRIETLQRQIESAVHTVEYYRRKKNEQEIHRH